MPNRPLQSIINHLRRTVTLEETGDLTDAQLLDNFVRRRDEAAFELLVWRHAAMVLGACQRLLHDWHEAEDAFQATFLVFARKAGSISKVESIGCWLHRVAVRIALRAKAHAAKRRHQALSSDDVPARAETDEVLWRDLRPVLEEEVNRLPEKYRRPFVLCYLEGNTNEQAAQQLGCPKGTILSRLLRGRERLRSRLARRGVVLSGSLLATLLISKASAATAPTVLVSATVKAAIPFAAGNAAASLVSTQAAALTEGVLKAMFMTKLKITAAVVFVVALAGAGAGLLSQPLLAEPRQAQAEREKPRGEVRQERGDQRSTASPEVRGVLKAVDPNKCTITIAVGDGRQEAVEKTFTVSKNAEVGVSTAGMSRRFAFREGKLADLAPGVHVSIALAADQKTAEAIMADGPMLRGVIKSVDGGKNSITITYVSRTGRRDEAPEQEEKTYTLAKNAEVAIDDGRGKAFSIKEAKLTDLPAGAIVSLKLAVDMQHAQAVVAEGGMAQGVVKAVDAGKKQIQLMTRGAGRGGEPEEVRTFDVSPGAEVLFDDGKSRRFSLKEGQLGDLPVGAIAVVKLAVDQQTAVSVRAEGPTASGAVKSVDPDKHVIVLVLRQARGDTPAEEKTYTVAKDARIVIDGREAKLAEVKVDENGPAIGLKLSLDQKVVQGIMVGNGAGRR